MAARMSVSFTEPQMKWLKAQAKKLGITTSDMVRRTVDLMREGIKVTVPGSGPKYPPTIMDDIPEWARPVCPQCGAWKGMWHGENCPERNKVLAGKGYADMYRIAEAIMKRRLQDRETIGLLPFPN